MKTLTMMCAVLLTAAVTSQEGAVTLPANYTIQFENAWVKVTNVRYGPNEKLPEHTHTPHPSAYVYLNDGGPVIFRHVGGPAATRPATKAGAFRVYRGLEEVHEAINTTAAPSEFLRVELKTEGREPAAFRGKFERPATASAEPMVHLDHPQVRISRVWVPAGQQRRVTAGSEPVLFIGLTSHSTQAAGHAYWVPQGGAIDLANPTGSAIDFLRFDLKTRPAVLSGARPVQN